MKHTDAPEQRVSEAALKAGRDISFDVYGDFDKCGRSFAITVQRAINETAALWRQHWYDERARRLAA